MTTTALAVAALCVLATRDPILEGAARLLTYEDAAPADYIVVLGGDPESRPFKAAELYRQRVAPLVLIFEYTPASAYRPSQSATYRRILEHEGVPAAAIVEAPGMVRSSWDEAKSLSRFLTAHPPRRVVVVTSAEHTRRARWAFRRALRGSNVDVRMAAARHLGFDESNWWRSDEGVLLYLHEYVKLPYYVFRYGIGAATD